MMGRKILIRLVAEDRSVDSPPTGNRPAFFYEKASPAPAA